MTTGNRPAKECGETRNETMNETMTYYLVSDCTPNNGTIEAAGTTDDIWTAIDSYVGTTPTKVIKLTESHDVGERIAIDWDASEVADLGAE